MHSISLACSFVRLSSHRSFSRRIFSKVKVPEHYMSYYGSIDVIENGEKRKVFLADSCRDLNNAKIFTKIPLVILPGTAQTASTYLPHYRRMSSERRLIIPELRGQGNTELDTSISSMKQHVQDFKTIMSAVQLEKVDLCGFSFGGRVALAVAAHCPAMVNKLSVTGVPLARPGLGKMIINSWLDSLSRSEIRSCGWSFVLNGFSQAFLDRYSDRVPEIVDSIVANNDPTKLHDLIKYSNALTAPEYSTEGCAGLVRCPTQILAARQDRIAGLAQVRLLAESIPTAVYQELDCGHLAPFELPNDWRNLVLQFCS